MRSRYFLRWNRNRLVLGSSIITRNRVVAQLSDRILHFLTLSPIFFLHCQYICNPHQHNRLSFKQDSWEFFNVGSWRIQHDFELTFVLLWLLFCGWNGKSFFGVQWRWMSEIYAKLCHDQAHLTLGDALHQRVMIILLNPFLQLQHVLAIGESNDTEVNANE